MGQVGAQALREGAGDPTCSATDGWEVVGGGGDVCYAHGHHQQAAKAGVKGELVDPPQHLGGCR